MRRLAFIDALARRTRTALISARRATRMCALQVQRGTPLVLVKSLSRDESWGQAGVVLIIPGIDESGQSWGLADAVLIRPGESARRSLIATCR